MRLTKDNVNDVFVTEFNFRLYILKAHNVNYQKQIKYLKMCLVNRKNDFAIFC